MAKINLIPEGIGRVAIGVKTPIIRPGDDLKKIVIDSCLETVGEFHQNAVICVTEAVRAIAQGNFATPDDIRADIARKYPDASEITLLFPIQSRNRFMNIPRAIAEMEQIKKIRIVLQYPCDEVGNRLIPDEILEESGVNPYEDSYTASGFYQMFGRPRHMFTGKNYIEEFENACNGKAEVILSNDLFAVEDVSDNILLCTIREDKRFQQRKRLITSGKFKHVYTMADILSESINGSGYSPEHGLYGSNMMAEGKLKLMPRNCQEFVCELQAEIQEQYGVHVEVMVYGDGAFKDPVGGIWELADPVTTLGATSGLNGTPQEVKLKFVASKYPDKTEEELQQIIAEERKKRIDSKDITGEASLGTTPRQRTDLLASCADLITGSGDEQTPVVYMVGFLK